jgi:hypothetical protein
MQTSASALAQARKGSKWLKLIQLAYPREAAGRRSRSSRPRGTPSSGIGDLPEGGVFLPKPYIFDTVASTLRELVGAGY